MKNTVTPTSSPTLTPKLTSKNEGFTQQYTGLLCLLFLTALLIVAPVSHAQVSSSPKHEFRFDELQYSNTANEVVDSIAGFNGQARSAQPVSGKVCNAVDLSGSTTGDYVALDESILNGATDFSISLWVKTPKTTNQSVLSGANSGEANELLMWFPSNTQFQPHIQGGVPGTINTSSIAGDVWRHLVWTRSSTQSCFYMNGAQQGCLSASTSAVTIEGLLLGQEQDSVGGGLVASQSFEGLIDELMIFDEVLTSTQVAQIYANQDDGNNYDGSSRTCPSSVLLAEYRFEEDTWNGTTDEVIDYTGNDYHGTLVGSNIVQSSDVPAISGNPGTCNFAELSGSSISVPGLPLDTSTVGAKTTLTFWMKWDGTSNMMPVGWNRHNIWINNGSMGFNTWNSDIYGVSTNVLSVNTWHHIAVEFTNGQVTNNKMFIDGTEQVLSQRFGSPNNSNATVQTELRIGGDGVTSFYNFSGDLDEVRVYQGTLSETEVSAIMISTHPCSSIVAPVLEYRFDQCTYTGIAGDVIDEGGNFNGSSQGILAPLNDAIINKSLDLTLSDTSDWVTVPNNAVDGLDDFTFSIWFKTAVDKSQQAIFQALGDNTSDDELEIHLQDDDTVVIKVRDNERRLDSSVDLADDSWHHLALTRVDNTVCLYIDGSQQDCDNSATSGVLSVTNANAIVIGQEQDSFGGSFSSTQSFEGQLDELKIFDVELSASAIDDIYQNERAGNNYDGTTRDVLQCSATCTTGTLNSVGILIDNGGTFTRIQTTSDAEDIYQAWLDAGSPEAELVGNGAYNIIYSATDTADRIDFGGSANDYAGTLPYPGATLGSGANLSQFVVQASGRISLPAGSYTLYVESDDGFKFEMNTVSGDTVTFTKFGLGSGDGDTNELRFEGVSGNTRTGGSFTITQDSIFDVEAMFFERTGGDFFEIGITNGITTSRNAGDYEVLRNGALGGDVAFVCSGAPLINHYQIIHDGQGLTCDAETVTINACTNTYDGSCTLSTEPVSLDFTVTGSSSIVNSIAFTGSTSTSIPYTIAETVVLSLANTSIIASNPDVCSDGSTASCNLVFADAGFRFLNGSTGTSETISNQISGTSFPLRIQAVQNNNGVCEGIFTGNQSINLSQENVNPSGTSGLSFSVDGNDILKYPSSSPTTLFFGTDSIATIPSATYHDAGQIRLRADYSAGGINLTGSSNNFWVSPAELVLSASVGSTTLNGASATASPTQKAGEDFTFTVTALNSQGVVTPNYSPGQLQLSLARIGPLLSGSVDGSFTYASGSSLASNVSPSFQNVSLSSFASGISTFSAAQYSEVGLLTADIQDSNYGNANIIVPASTINIGRFIPDHFVQTIADDGMLQATCGSSLTFSAFSGQKDEATNSVGAISYLTNPVLAITAYNKQGSITQNYYQDSDGSANDFMKLSEANISVNLPTLDELAVGVDTSLLPITSSMSTGTLSQNDLTALPSVVALPRGVVHYQLSDADHFFYNRSANALVAPFTSDIDFTSSAIVDTDNVTATSTVAASPTGVEIRFARMVLANSFGPETSDIPQPMQIEHFNGSSFIATPDDNCSTFDASKVTLSNVSLNPNLTDVLGGTGDFVAGQTQDLILEAPGAGNQGQIGVTYDSFEWFLFDWDNDGVYDDNPSAIATFGIYRGNDRVIHWREVFND